MGTYFGCQTINGKVRFFTVRNTPGISSNMGWGGGVCLDSGQCWMYQLFR